MNPDEILVGGLAIVFAVLGFSIGIGPWEKPYQLRTFQRVRERHGKPAARAAWIILSIAFLLVGTMALHAMGLENRTNFFFKGVRRGLSVYALR